MEWKSKSISKKREELNNQLESSDIFWALSAFNSKIHILFKNTQNFLHYSHARPWNQEIWKEYSEKNKVHYLTTMEWIYKIVPKGIWEIDKCVENYRLKSLGELENTMRWMRMKTQKTQECNVTILRKFTVTNTYITKEEKSQIKTYF